MLKTLKILGVLAIGLIMVTEVSAVQVMPDITYVGKDTTTQGNWIGKYGSVGYDIMGVAMSLPAGMTISTPMSWGNTPWAGDWDADPLALQKPTGGRTVTCAFSNPDFGLYLDLGPTTKQVALYLYFGVVDGWPRSVRVDTIDNKLWSPTDPVGFQLAPAFESHSFSDGEWLIFKGSGQVLLRMWGISGNKAGNWVNLSAVMIDNVKIPGDADLNGKVDFQDYLALESSFGNTVTPGTGADFDNNGVVNFQDYLTLESNFGAGTVIPEPMTMSLLGLGALALIRRR